MVEVLIQYPHVLLDGKYVGKIRDNTYFTERKKKEHFYRKLRGYPISLAILEKLQERGNIENIVIIEKLESGVENKYICRLRLYLSGKKIQHEGYDAQLVVPLSKLKPLRATGLQRWFRSG